MTEIVPSGIYTQKNDETASDHGSSLIGKADVVKPVAWLWEYSKHNGVDDLSGITRQKLVAEQRRLSGAAITPLYMETKMTDAQIKHMVSRFLAWELPQDFGPDGGISFKCPLHEGATRHWPVGTNLLTATQAEAMLRHMIEGLPE